MQEKAINDYLEGQLQALENFANQVVINEQYIAYLKSCGYDVPQNVTDVEVKQNILENIRTNENLQFALRRESIIRDTAPFSYIDRLHGAMG